VGEIAGGLLDYAVRAVRGIKLGVTLDSGGLLEITADRPWIVGDASAILNVVTSDPPFGEPTLGLYVAAGAARLLGTSIQIVSDRVVWIQPQIRTATQVQ
jgi:hypothetical protein